jgi:hypothetical protein
VLWVLGTAAIVASTALVAGRNSAGATRNRIEWTRAHWRALGCARRAQSAIDSMVGVRSTAQSARVWRALGRAVDSLTGLSDCDITLEAAGARLDVNSASIEMLERLFAATGRTDGRRLALAIGAARETAPIADVHALRGVDATVDWTTYDSLLSVEPGRIAIVAAPATVLEAIPGFSPELANAVVARREAGELPADVNDVLSLVSRGSARELEDRFLEASRVAVADPDAWLLRSVAHSGNPRIIALVEWRIIREAGHVVVVRSTSR